MEYYQSTKNTVKDKVYLFVLKILSRENEISRRRLINTLKPYITTLGYLDSTVENAVSSAIASLSESGLVKILTFEQYVANGHLKKQQIANYASWLKYAGIITGHGHQNVGEYTKEEIEVFRKIGYYVSRGVSPIDAVKRSLKYVLGKDEVKKFEEWYGKHLSARRASTRLKRARLLEQQKPHTTTKTDWDIYTALYRDYLQRNEQQGKLEHVHNALLERLIEDFSKQYAFAQKYPFNLYFKLSNKDPTAEIRNKIVNLMTSMDVQKPFAAYEDAIFESLRESLCSLVSKLEFYLDEGFREAEKGIETLNLIQHRGKKGNFRRYLSIIRDRYQKYTKTRTLRETGQNFGWQTRERMSQLEAKALRLLGNQSTIQQLVHFEFWKIQ